MPKLFLQPQMNRWPDISNLVELIGKPSVPFRSCANVKMSKSNPSDQQQQFITLSQTPPQKRFSNHNSLILIQHAVHVWTICEMETWPLNSTWAGQNLQRRAALSHAVAREKKRKKEKQQKDFVMAKLRRFLPSSWWAQMIQADAMAL